MDELVLGFSGDAHHHPDLRMLVQLRQLLRDVSIETDIFETDGIEHAVRQLVNARRQIALAGMHRDRLGDHTTQARKINQRRILFGVAADTRCDEHRILVTDRSNLNADVAHGTGRSSHSNTLASNTGPSWHTVRYGDAPSSLVGTTHARHAPSAQPMRFSSDAQCGTPRASASFCAARIMTVGPHEKMTSAPSRASSCSASCTTLPLNP